MKLDFRPLLTPFNVINAIIIHREYEKYMIWIHEIVHFVVYATRNSQPNTNKGNIIVNSPKNIKFPIRSLLHLVNRFLLKHNCSQSLLSVSLQAYTLKIVREIIWMPVYCVCVPHLCIPKKFLVLLTINVATSWIVH